MAVAGIVVAEPAAEPAPPSETPPPLVDTTRVAVLGYHDFSESEEETEMRIRTSKFRRQLEILRELGLTVISLDQFIRWKEGELSLPERCVLLTIDDGWKATYTEAFPILREFDLPFTLFLYKNYIEGGNKALDAAMIREMIERGASLGSHSVSHPYPADVKVVRLEGADAFARFLRTEMGESKRFLEMTFGRRVTTYAYPGGFFTDDMFPIAAEIGYTYLFTVEPGKVTRDTPDRLIPRYVILGTHDRVFEIATNFDEQAPRPAGLVAGLTADARLPVAPPPGAIVNDRLPRIEADLSGVDDLDPASVVMKVGGFGTVPAAFDPQSGRLTWQVDRRLRQRFCQVLVSWKDAAGTPAAEPLRWSFQIDRTAAYLPRD